MQQPQPPQQTHRLEKLEEGKEETEEAFDQMWRDKIGVIMRQTTYTESEADQQLTAANGNVDQVLRVHYGIPEKKKEPEKKSVNQQIYREIRRHLDSAMQEYQVRVDKGEAKRII